MPPKKNTSKSKEVIASSTNGDSSSKKQKQSNNSAEPSTRTLRPRRETPVDPAKPKIEKTTKSKEANGVAKTKNQSLAKRKKANVDKTHEDGEPDNKHGKVEEEDDDEQNNVSANSIYEFTAKKINGEEISLSKYKGHVCIIVNVASKCGHTASNYKELVELHENYGESKGLQILAFPCNQFAKQEPGDNEKICEFAKKRNVNFDMFEKIDVNGKNAHPLWKYLTSEKEGPKVSKIDWNFTKFLINKEGQVVERFKSAVKPSALVKDLEKLW